MPPRAYYRDLTTTAGTPLDIALLACDPDNPATSAGMTWQVSIPPAGQISALSGTYPDAIINYDPDLVPAGSTDSFWYYVMDADGAASGEARIRVTVTDPGAAGQRLYFMAKDPSYRSHLWYYNGTDPIATVPGSAQALSADGLEWFQKGVPYQSDIHFIVADTSGENNRSWSYNPSSGTFRFYPQVTGVVDLVESNSLLYASAYASGTFTAYLWELGSGGWTPLVSVAGPGDLAAFNNRIYFAGDAGGGNFQLLSYDPAGSVLATETFTANSLWPWNLTVCNGELYFNGTVGTVAPVQYLWALDGVSPAATVTNTATSPENMICFDNKLYFTARGAPASTLAPQLWTLDATGLLDTLTNVTSVLGFMNTGSNTYPAVAGSVLYMRGNDSTSTNWLWAHSGSGPLTTVPDSGSLFPFYTTAFDGRLFFSSSWIPGPTYLIDNMGTYDPGTGLISALSNAPSPGFYSRSFVVYPP